MHKIVVTCLLACAAGCGTDPRGESDGAARLDQDEAISGLVDAQVERQLDERLTSIEMSLEQIQLQIEVLVEEVKSAQAQQERLAAFETEVKQALLDLGNIMRRALSSSNLRQPSNLREGR